MRLPLVLSVVCAALPAPASAAESAPSPREVEFFEAKVRPLLTDHCQRCHGPAKQHGGLRLDSRAAALKGGDHGPALVTEQPEKSRLIQAIRHDRDDLKMPPDKKLPAESIEVMTTWVKMGAPWPDVAGETAKGPPTPAEARKSHWSFKPVRKPEIPAVKDREWGLSPLDAFVLAGLEGKGLAPAPHADRRTLIRRVSLDLVGLPPTPEEVEAFVNDKSADAYEALLDRLLASPRYGERWGRHWLDVARYADTKGYVFEEERRYPYAYTYRDYVIRAFNEDLPYDRFVLEQLAADRLALGEDKRPLAAMGFLTLGRRFLNNTQDIVDDRIDVTMRGLQGLTVTCARCHDHKFDPIPQKDYYSLYGVFASSTEPKDLPLVGEPEKTAEYLAFEKELNAREGKVKEYLESKRGESDKELSLTEVEKKLNRADRTKVRELRKQVEQWKVTGSGSPPRGMVLAESSSPHNPHVFLRGNANTPGPAVPRQFLAVVVGDDRKPFKEGGRLEMAKAIASKDNALTARVMVNRVWLHHFGQGLVRTPSDFGLRGDPPTHPELLDWLAATFVEQGWSVKKLHRLILTSATYRQSSDAPAKTLAADPENRLLGRFNRLRLEFEPLRDSLLAVSGRLDTTAGGAPVDLTKAPFSGRRSVYGFVERQNLPGLFRTFDFASPDATVGQRHNTTVPQQALFLMNSPFALEQARAFAAQPDVAKLDSAEQRIGRMYRLAYGRAPDAEEVAMGVKFLAAKADDKVKLTALERYAQVLLLSNEFAFVD